MRKLVVTAMFLAATGGCVLGRSPTARHTAMVVDGALAAGGIALAATANHSSSEFATGVADSVANSLQTDLGAVAVAAGIIGLLINVAIAPDKPAPENVAPHPVAALHVAPSANLSLSALTIDPAP
ncbi:MAG TPA: hypothetical protein VFQ65_09040 [Kofleriaceae bacterium]|nr:hypothetical protein [Kofleriaceae bacterium]